MIECVLVELESQQFCPHINLKWQCSGAKTRGGELIHGGVPPRGLYVDPFWNFDKKVGPFSEFLCPMEVSKIRS